MLPSTPLSLALFASPALATAFSDLLPRNETANSTDKCHGEVDNIWDYANATTNLTIPGFTPPGFSPRNWTVNIGLRDSRDALRNTSQDQVTLWIDSPAEDDNLTSVDLPYIGCVVAFDMRQYKKSSGQGGEDGCKGVFSDKCYNALVSKAKSAAEAQSGETRERKTSLLCMDMARLDDESCDDSEVSVASSVTSFFGNGTECSEPGMAEGSRLRAAGSFLQVGGEGSYYNYTTYEQMATNAQPIMFVAWLKSTTESDEKWGDARLLCPTTDQIQPGSRAISAATSVKRPGGGFYVALAISAAISVSMM